MMNEEEKFDDLLRQKMSERDFFFDEENWQKLNEKIESQDKKKKQTRFIIIFLSGLAFGVLFTVPLMYVFTNNHSEKLLTSSHTEGSTPSGAVTKSQAIAANPNNTAGESNNAVQNTSAPTASENTNPENGNSQTAKETGNDNNSITKPVVSSANSENATAVNKPTSQKNSNAQVAINNASHNKTWRSRNNSISNTDTKAVASTSNNERTVSAVTHKSHNKNKNVANTVANNESGETERRAATNNTNSTSFAANNTPEKNNESANNVNSNRKSVNSTQSNSNNGSQNNQQAATNNAQQGNNSVSQSQLSINNNSNANNQATATNNKKADSNQNAITAANKKDTGLVPMGKQPAPRKASYTLSIDAGGNYAFGWANYKLNNEGSGMSPVFGFSATHFLSKKTALSLGVQYNSITHLKTGYTSSVTNYDFGYTTNYTTVMPTTLYYLSVPLYLRYNLDDEDAFCLGTSLQYLITASCNVTSGVDNTLHTGTVQNKTEYGYTNGFNNVDIQVRLAYRRKIIKSLSITAEGYFGLMDVENSYFSDGGFKRNKGLQVILSYDLIK